MQKETYPVSKALQQYLQQYKRDMELPVAYNELLHYRYSDAIKDEDGKHTHWENVVYEESLFKQLQKKLIAAYALLKNSIGKFEIKAIDFCEFANSMPFRITIGNIEYRDADFFYIKSADASRVYGLELEELLSPNHTNFLYHQNTLMEEHIEGVPGDIFLKETETLPDEERKLVAEEFVRFNERCFVRLLGDMRSYNFVVIKNENSPGNKFHIRAIDFDQQCYEGKMNLYLPQFYKENYGYVQMALTLLGDTAIEEIRMDERKLLIAKMEQSGSRLNNLLAAMAPDEISENYKVLVLRKELDRYFNTTRFAHCKTMGSIVSQQVKHLL